MQIIKVPKSPSLDNITGNKTFLLSFRPAKLSYKYGGIPESYIPVCPRGIDVRWLLDCYFCNFISITFDKDTT